MDTPKITDVQKRILAYINDCVEERGMPPTLREIGARLGISSTGSVAYHLRALEQLGLIKKRSSLSRGLAPLDTPYRLPILGRVGAGAQVIAQEDVEGHLTLSKEMASGADYLLRVRGESMTGAGIFEGDLVQVRRQDDANDGDIVVAVAEEAGLVKRLRRRGKERALLSEHEGYAPITSEFQVVGKVLGLIRSYKH